MKTLVVGGAGFIGKNLVRRLLDKNENVIAIDKLEFGSESITTDPNFQFKLVDINDSALVNTVLEQEDISEVWHLAANADIPAGVQNIDVDLEDTFMSTVSVLKLMKAKNIRRLYFASSSAIYGDCDTRLSENFGPLFPISNYGAMKLSSEALISASLESFLEKVCIYRFPNVVGTPATHGVLFDFVNKLKHNPRVLQVLGNGTQTKAYMHVEELIDAMMYINKNTENGLNYFNIGANDDGICVKDIAELTVGAISPQATIEYENSDRGWVGDVPRFTYSVEKLRALGWSPNLSSRDAVIRAISEIYTRKY
jgi:UDP-glucose 4-epimerase